MSKATGTRESASEIAARRFANGEIGADEYQALMAALREAGAEEKSPQPNSIPLESIKAGLKRIENHGVMKFFQAIGFAIIALAIASSALRSCSNDGGALHVRNVRSSGLWGDIITGQVLNEGSSGTVFVWIEAGGRIYCPRATHLRRREYQRFEIRCYDMAGRSGTFSVRASRNPSATIRNNALSL